MEIGKECEPYLQSDEVIKILTNPDQRQHTKVFDCLRNLKRYFFSTVPDNCQTIPDETLNKFAEEALATAKMEFYETVKLGRFKPDKKDCVPFVKIIFKRAFFKLLAGEIKINHNLKNYVYTETTKTENEGEKKLLKKDSFALKTNAVLLNLSEEDRKIYDLRYVKDMSRSEIAAFLNITPKAVTNKLIKLHKRFREEWNK